MAGRAPRGDIQGFHQARRGARAAAAIARLARAIVLGTLARVRSRFPERLGALTGAATGRVGAAGPRRGCQGEGRVSRAETVQLVAGLGLGSLIWMVNDFPDGQGALTKRSGRAVERALRGGFPGVPPERRGARAAAAIARLVRSEAVGGTARTPCAFAERGEALTGPSRPAGVINAAWRHYSPITPSAQCQIVLEWNLIDD